MIETSLTAWLSLMAMIFLASAAGYSISRLLPWSDSAIKVGMPFASGLALAPFLAGFVSISVLVLLPREEHALHLAASLLALTLGTVIFALRSRGKPLVREATRSVLGLSLLKWCMLVWVLLLLINTLFLPLTANDALEYAMVGRELYLNPSLANYPMLSPEETVSGFFAPWTHPPLYVSMIYLMSVIQGHADAPGLTRLIAPWFLLSSTGLMVVLGRLFSLPVGWLAGVLYLSTPLLFLGASSALIDALPVSAMVLLIAAMAGIRQGHPSYPIVAGTVLGIGLWSHSQAILFIPLFVAAFLIQQGFRDAARIIRALSVVLAVAISVGGAWYVRNYLLFGSPISDNPQVFALQELNWRNYFAVARGLNQWGAMLQYGILKGWFGFEAYGAVFWLFAGGAGLFLWRRSIGQVLQTLRSGSGVNGGAEGVLWVALVISLTYFTGVVISVALDVDLMVRNDRYLLIVLPSVVLVGAFFLSATISKMWSVVLSSSVRVFYRDTLLVVLVLFALLVTLHAALVGWSYNWRNVPVSEGYSLMFGQDDEKQQQKHFGRIDRIVNLWPSLRLHRTLEQYVGDSELILSLRPADMYYSKRKMVSYLDPRLLPFYLEKSPEKAVEMLRELGIRFVISPDYSLPTVYNSSLMRILSDPALSQLVASEGANQLYRLEGGRMGRWGGERIDLTPGKHPWVQSWQTRFGFQPIIEFAGLRPRLFSGGVSESHQPFFHRDYRTLLATGKSQSLKSLNWGIGANTIAVEPGDYLLQVQVSGKGYITLWVAEFDANGGAINKGYAGKNVPMRIGDLPLSGNELGFDYARRLRFNAATRYVRFGIEHQGQSRLTIYNMTLERLPRDLQ